MSGGGELLIVSPTEHESTIFVKRNILKVEAQKLEGGIYKREISAEETQGDTVNIGPKW